MSSLTFIEYYCEKCDKKLKTCKNNLDIVTKLNDSNFWSRLHVNILKISGVNNESKTEKADLCKNCTIELLSNALHRVRNGERTTKGSESIEEEGWND